jgi:hypothetical protein
LAERKNRYPLDVLIRLIIAALAIIWVLVVCPIIWGSVTLECVVIILIVVIVVIDLIPGTGKGGW